MCNFFLQTKHTHTQLDILNLKQTHVEHQRVIATEGICFIIAALFNKHQLNFGGFVSFIRFGEIQVLVWQPAFQICVLLYPIL